MKRHAMSRQARVTMSIVYSILKKAAGERASYYDARGLRYKKGHPKAGKIRKITSRRYKWAGYWLHSVQLQQLKEVATKLGLRITEGTYPSYIAIHVPVNYKIVPGEIDWRPTETIPEDFYAQ